MVKYYKEVSTCTMCKQRFVVNKEKGMYSSSNYCPGCKTKYFPKKIIEPGSAAEAVKGA